MNSIALKHKYLNGFTIVELMLSLAVAAVILTIGVPSFQGLIERNQLTSGINQIISSMSLARSEAIKRNQRVSICPSSDGATCLGNQYENGWIVFVDRNSNGSRQAADEELIWVSGSLPSNMTLRGTAGCCENNIPYLASGQLNAISGSMHLCKENNADKSRKIAINSLGRARFDKAGSENCAI
ncbi:MAG: GspH/FimT family pseudopilin [Gammaproteobacteria bacterium]